MAAFAAEAGGTLEQNLWEVLILAGLGETAAGRWDGYRFGGPDHILS
jgi:hypothetical protein